MGNSNLSKWQSGRPVLPIAAAGMLWIAQATAHGAGPPPRACDATLLAALDRPSGTAYGVRSGGRYCEGTVPALNSGSLALIGVHLGSAQDPSPDLIQVAVPPATGATGPVSITAIDIGHAKSYRLDAEVPSAGLTLDVALVMRPLGLRPSQLAFRASFDSGASVLMVPTLLGQDKTGPVRVLYDATEPVRRFRAQIVDDSGATVQQDVVLDDIKARALIVVPLDRSTASRWVMVKATAYSPLGDAPMPSRTYRIYVPAKE